MPTGRRRDAGPGAIADFSIDVTLRADPLTAIMLAMVTFISTLVAIYSIGYMHGDRGLLAVLQLHRPVRLFDDDAGVGQQFRAAVCVLGSGRACAAILLVGFWYREARGGRGRQEGVSGQSRRRFRFCIWVCF